MELDFSKEDFMTPAPYKMILSIEDAFERQLALRSMAEYADANGVKAFQTLYKAYCNSIKAEENTIYMNSVTNFAGQEITLDCGQWCADDMGVSRRSGGFGEEIACPHPIMPVERLINIDTGVEKLKIAFRKGRQWRKIVVDKQTLATANKIVALSDSGVAVTSESAKALVRYISDVENINYDRIPERKCVGRLGYIPDEGFSPFVEGLEFDGRADYATLFHSVRSFGSKSKWKAVAIECRKMSTTARLLLAASFASVLIEPLGALPFFVHLWGSESGTGKTVALMLAVSVWADPENGRYMQTFDSTKVGHEKVAAFLNSLPMAIDELQLARDKRGKINFNVYELAQGVGRTRGTKTGGVERTPTWRNCILTTGESPLTTLADGAGAINRVLDIECTPSEPVITDGRRVLGVIRKNFGFAGKTFINQLNKTGVMDEVEKRYNELLRTLSEGDTTEKQAAAAAAVIVADELISKWFFDDDKPLTIADMSEFLQTKASVSMGDRGYRYMCDWVAQHSLKFREDADTGDIYGRIEENWALVISKVFREACEAGGFSSTALLSYLKEKKLIQTRGKRNTCNKRIRGIPTECIAMRIGIVDDEADFSQEDGNDDFIEI